VGRVVHFEIHCGDLDRAERFYRDVFGWEIQRYEGAPVDYRLVTTGPDGEPGIDGALVGRRGEIDGQAVIAYVSTIAVEDLAATHERIVASGGERAVERYEVPGVGHLAYFKDTEGNLFGVLEPTAAG
jgi:uncharacterized protein